MALRESEVGRIPGRSALLVVSPEAGGGSPSGADMSNDSRRDTVAGMARRKRKEISAVPTAKPQTSDQAPGEEVVQVNDRYKRRAAPPDMTQEEQAQHQTGG